MYHSHEDYNSSTEFTIESLFELTNSEEYGWVSTKWETKIANEQWENSLKTSEVQKIRDSFSQNLISCSQSCS